jgi:hypothetical protein
MRGQGENQGVTDRGFTEVGRNYVSQLILERCLRPWPWTSTPRQHHCGRRGKEAEYKPEEAKAKFSMHD